MRPFDLRALVAVISVTLAALVPGQDEPGAPPTEREVVVVPVKGDIGTTTVALVNRAMRAARSLGAKHVVLDIDTHGGLQDAMERIENILNAMRGGRSFDAASPPGSVRVVSFVRKNAWSAGGYLALACDATFMAPGASIGAITPVLVGPTGVSQIPDEDVRRKVYSALRARVRAMVARREGVSESTLKISEAMVDPTIRVVEVTYRDENAVSRTEIFEATELESLALRGVEVTRQQDLSKKVPLTLTANQALRHGISSATYDSLDDLLSDEIGVPPSAVYRMEETWSESAVAWLEGMKPVLFILGFVLLLVEAKVPGLIVPGVLGVLLIAMGLFSSYLVGLAEWTEILLFFLGLILIGVEIFVMPGTLVFGFFGFVAVVFSLILSQQTFVLPGDSMQEAIFVGNLLNLLYLTLLVIAGAVLFYRFMPKIPFFNRALLVPPEGARTGDSTRFAKAGATGRDHLVGIEGTATTDLRPSGIVEVGGDRFDVVTTGGFVGRGQPVRVIEVEGNRIVVEAIAGGGGGRESGEVALGLIFLLLVVGLCLVVAEIFFVSAGILSVGAAVSLISAIFLGFTHHGEAVGFLILGLEAVGVPLCIAWAMKVLPRTPLGRKLLLSGPATDRVHAAAQEEGIHELVGQEGVTLSALRPAGFARIQNRRVDVVTRGEMLESDTTVRVIEVEGNRVVVAAVPSTDTHNPTTS